MGERVVDAGLGLFKVVWFGFWSGRGYVVVLSLRRFLFG